MVLKKQEFFAQFIAAAQAFAPLFVRSLVRCRYRHSRRSRRGRRGRRRGRRRSSLLAAVCSGGDLLKGVVFRTVQVVASIISNDPDQFYS